MRITNSMLVDRFLSNYNTNLNSLQKLQNQMYSGKKFAHISDDPVSLIYSQQAKYKLSRLSDYSRNVEMSSIWLKQAETGVLEMDKVLQSAYESCIDASTDIKNGKDFSNIAAYIGQLRDQVLNTLNTTLGDKYIYGGYNTTGFTEDGKNVPPFTVKSVDVQVLDENGDPIPVLDEFGDPVVDGGGNPVYETKAEDHLHYNGVDLCGTDQDTLDLIDQLRQDVMTFDIAFGTELPVSVNGIEFAFYGKDPDTGENLNIYNLLSNMYNTLMTDGVRAEDIDVYISDLQLAQNHVLSHSAEIGGRVNRIEILEARYAQDELNYTQMLSDAEDADLAEVIMNFSMASAVYNASLAAGARIIQPTLMDFLG